jgi:hypothetical protein
MHQMARLINNAIESSTQTKFGEYAAPFEHVLAPRSSPPLTIERLKSFLEYDPETGDFRWLITDRKRRTGALAGTITNWGYRTIVIDYKAHRVNRLAYFYMTGQWPESVVDYVDHDTLNNRWENLRAATKAQNDANRKMMSHNSSGIKGVFWGVYQNRWMAQVMRDGKPYRREFRRRADAVRFVEAKRVELHGEFACHG